MGLLYRAGWTFYRGMTTTLYGLKIEGLSNVPTEGGFILAGNHRSYLDPPLLGCCMWRPIHYFAKRELFKNPIAGHILRAVKAIPVSRGTIDRSAINSAVEIIKRGAGLTMFPEGTRSHADEFLPPRPGVGMIATRAGCPIVPAYIHGTNRLGHCFRHRGMLRVTFGEAIPSDWVVSCGTGKQAYEKIGQTVMDRIRELRIRLIELKPT